MRYRLAHSREIKKNRWNNVCPSCGHHGKFSPYIDTVTNEPIAVKECGRCCREKSCAYHMTPKEWFKEHKTPPLIPPPRGEDSAISATPVAAEGAICGVDAAEEEGSRASERAN